jgi:hypothetical protein
VICRPRDDKPEVNTNRRSFDCALARSAKGRGSEKHGEHFAQDDNLVDGGRAGPLGMTRKQQVLRLGRRGDLAQDDTGVEWSDA